MIKQKRNASHKPFFEDKSRWVISYGGAGSAKSYSTAQKILTRIISEENHKFLITRKVAKTLRVSVFQLFKDVISDIELSDDFKINKSDMTITYIHNNSTLLFFGLDDIEKLKSIQGITGIWVEEASECDQNDIMELNRRLRGITPYYKQIILTFNPISHLHWLKSHFFDNPANKASIYKTTYLDNKFLDDEYKQEIEDIKNYDIQQYNIYALGEWGVLNTNIVYHNFKFNKHTTTLTIDDFDILHCGVDFNVGGSVCVICGIKDNKVYVVDGWAVYDTQQIADKLNGTQYQNHQKIIYPDASGGNESANASRSSLEILQDNGLRINANKSNPAVRDRINAVNRKLARDEVFISDRVEKLIFSLQTQAYLDNGKPEKYTEHKGGAIDDWNDALGYFIAYKYPIQTYGKISGGFVR
ncbi:MAG: PBSX family phage terminase large subunit [Gammaproteobacteria bacterium]|nr:PBSX family phage terminase large subunit [Gammaproteobacteria bacterium]